MKKQGWIYAALLSSSCLVSSYSLKADPVSIAGFESGTEIESFLEIYKGKSQNPNEIINASDSLFSPYNWNIIPAGSSDTWLLLKIDNPANENEQFVLGNNQFQYLEFYEPTGTGVFRVSQSGTLCEHRFMEIVFGANSWIPFTAPAKKVSLFLIKATNIQKVKYQYAQLGFTLYTYKDFTHYQRRQTFFNYFFWGALLIITLYNLVLFFQLKSRIYLYYVANNLVILLFVLSQAGLTTELFFKNSRYHEQLLLFFGNIAFIFYILFCKEFLDLKKVRPKLNRIFNIILWLWPLPMIFILFNLSEIAVSVGGLVAIWGYTMIMVSAYRSIKLGDTGARFFFIANLFYYLGIIISILQIAKLLPYVFLGLSSVNFVQVGTISQVCLFSLTVGFRIIRMQNEIAEKQLEQEKIRREEEHKRSLLIEEQNQTLEKKVKDRTLELEQQKVLLVERQKEIIDSITYARYIQYTLLAHESLLKANLPNYFILFQPKDIVSGDFYWAIKKENKFYMAICDCTGHGVPGAFMSVLIVSLLNEAITEKEILEPDKILGFVRSRLVGNPAEKGFSDGMDGTIICFTEGSPKAAYASAFNKPVLVRDNQLSILPADKMPVGKGENRQAFTLHSIDIRKGDSLYFYTDGFADQFGGPSGKKFKYKKLNEVLLSNHQRSSEEQKLMLLETFTSWKGNQEQVDDICVMGLNF